MEPFLIQLSEFDLVSVYKIIKIQIWPPGQDVRGQNAELYAGGGIVHLEDDKSIIITREKMEMLKKYYIIKEGYLHVPDRTQSL